MISRALLILCMILTLAAGLCAAETTVWQIGDFDNCYEDLAIPHDYGAYNKTYPKDVTFTVGKSDPAKDWPFIHPGPTDAWARSRAHPYQVLFDLPSAPSGVFGLTIDLVSTHGGDAPVLEMSLNGQSGRFALPQGSGDNALSDCAQGREHVIKLTLPPKMFRKGENTLALKITEGSWMLYDAISLTNDSTGLMPQYGVNKVSLTPTMFLVKRGGKIKQIVRLNAEFYPGVTEASAVIRSTGQNISLKPNLLGIAESDLEVNEVKSPTPLEVTVSCGSSLVSASCELKPQRHWRLYVQPSSHIDVGYTDWQERVIDLHNRNMSLALDLCKRYPAFVWNTEVAWPEDNYLSMMPKDRRDEFIKYAKSGQIGCQAIYGNMLTGICSHESFIRDLYYAHNVAREYGIPFDMAVSSDVPTQVWTLPTVLAGAGIKYFSAGLNLTRGDSFNQLFNKPFYWQGPDGAKVLAWFAPGYAHAAHLGLQTSVETAVPRVLGLLSGFDRADYPYDAVLAFGGVSDNQPFRPDMASVVAEWNKRYEYPKIIFTRGPSFFQHIEKNFAKDIPTIAGDGGVYWEDGAGSSAMETADVRIAKEQLATAEKIYSLLSTYGIAEYPKAEIDAAWKNAILYDEHTWGAHCSISQPASDQTIHQWNYKKRFATLAEAQSEQVFRDAMSDLAKATSAKEGEIVVYNPLSWPVSGPVELLSGPDGSLPHWADNVPPMGCRVISGLWSVAVGAKKRPLENNYYRVEFDPATGAIKSLFDKELGAELVDQSSAEDFNQYMYFRGGQPADVTECKASAEAVEFSPGQGRSGSRVSGSAHLTPKWTTEVVLYENLKRIDFINRLEKTETYEKEAGYFAFPFNLYKPEFYVELPDGVVKPKSQMLPGACMQWYCAQDFVAAADDKCAVVWSAVESPLITIGDVNREIFQSPLPIENGHLYAYAFNNYWFTNYKASQGGEMEFRYSLTSMPKYDPVAASRFGQSVRCPLVAWKVTLNTPAKSAPGIPTSLVSVSAQNVNVQAVKQAESGEGLIIRLRELTGEATPVTLTLPKGKFKEAWSCTLVEDPLSRLKLSRDQVTVTVPANGLATVWVK
ncbi:MAG: hypothetical protein KBC96_00940 [Armatimonadetes bacterium]|nr:hypothetical protein [Armatimonadota bacterium]